MNNHDLPDPKWKDGPPEGRELTVTISVVVQIESRDPDEDGSEIERSVMHVLRAAGIDADTEVVEVEEA